MGSPIDIWTVLENTLLAIGCIVLLAIDCAAIFALVWFAVIPVATWVWTKIRGEYEMSPRLEYELPALAFVAGFINFFLMLIGGGFHLSGELALSIPELLFASLFAWTAFSAVVILLEAMCLVAWNTIEKMKTSRRPRAMVEEEALTKGDEDPIELGSPV